MPRPHLALAVSLAGVALGAQDQAPIVPGLHGRHGLDEREVGELLLAELRCTACHADAAPAPLAPDLSEVGSRVSRAYLERFLADPAHTQPGTKMPAVLPVEGRDNIALLLANYLTLGGDLGNGTANAEARAQGERLFHSVGCVACHAPRVSVYEGEDAPEERAGAVPLAHVPEKYSLDSLAAFLFQPLNSRPSGRMPDLLLKRGEARAIASYLLDGAAALEPALTSEFMAPAGKQHYDELGCATCHEPESASRAKPRAQLDPSKDCRVARYPLDDGQRAAIESALRAPVSPTDEERIASTLTALNCIGCHVRGAQGGLDPETDLYFWTDEPELGDEARIPPQLDDVGAKLTSDWLDRVLFSGAAVRPYMHTRMPQFGDANLAHLPALLERVDSIEPYPLATPERDARGEARDVGRKLLGSKGGACVSCHAFNGRDSVLRNGMDLITSYERLRPDWFARFVIRPQKYRKGIIMPESWPDGVSVHDELDGDTQRQIEALWYFLSLGTSAPEPEGLRPVRHDLLVEGTTRTYRGRSSIAGYRGIAVGFPGGVNYAFNAHTGTLSGLWKGNFVNVRWGGQGAGGFNPAARAVQLAQDTSFARIGADEAWPLKPVMTKEEPVDPDPLYPRNVGYRFKGYTLDEQSIPTFEYLSVDVAIQDRSHADTTADGRPRLRRILTFDSLAGDSLHMRVLTGVIEKVADGRYRVPRLEVHVPEERVLLRPVPSAENEHELLLALPLPKGPSDLTIDYVFLD